MAPAAPGEDRKCGAVRVHAELHPLADGGGHSGSSGRRIAFRVMSAGVRAGLPDPYAVAVMDEIGIDLSEHEPQSLGIIGDQLFDIIISLSPEAHHHALELTRTMAAEVEYWPTMDCSLALAQPKREHIIAAYRGVRDELFERIRARFAPRRRADCLEPAVEAVASVAAPRRSAASQARAACGTTKNTSWLAGTLDVDEAAAFECEAAGEAGRVRAQTRMRPGSDWPSRRDARFTASPQMS